MCLWAQDKESTEKAKLFLKSDADTTKLLNGKIKIISHGPDKEKTPDKLELTTKKDTARKQLETSWGSFDIGFNNYIDNSLYNINYFAPNTNPEALENFCVGFKPTKGDFELRSGKSININIGIVKQQLSLYKHYVNLVYGLTYDINNWSYKNAISWNKTPNNIKAFPSADQGPFISKDSISFRKNKLVTNYLQVPLLLRFETSPHHASKNVYLSVGGYAGYLVRSHTKQIETGTTSKIKQHNDFNINKFQYGAQAELGYQGFSIYFKRSMTTLTDYGTVQYPYSFGVRLTGL
jgi:hypothetical protein